MTYEKESMIHPSSAIKFTFDHAKEHLQKVEGLGTKFKQVHQGVSGKPIIQLYD